MQTPTPAPYDISEIPYMPWVPSPSVWAAIVVGLALLALAVWRRNAPRARKGDLKIVDTLITELKASTTASAEVNLERASRIARRLVSYRSGRNVLELTGDELRASVSEETPPTLKRIILAAASVEEIGYEPASSRRDAAARELASQLVTLIDEYRSEVRAR
jgi:hypothetical protein